jgi:hypothetical protein
MPSFRMPYLFDPAAVTAETSRLPALARAIGNVATEGAVARTIPSARSSSRQLFRILGNTHYDHLQQLLVSLDRCLADGFSQPDLLKTRGAKDFASSLAELAAAEHFLLRGFRVSGFQSTKRNGSVPDLLIEKGATRALVEVYCPQPWAAMNAYDDGLNDLVKNLDAPFDYRFDVKVSRLENFDASGRLLYTHPGDLNDALIDPNVRGELLSTLHDRLLRALSRPRKRLTVQLTDRPRNLVTRITLSRIKPASGLPARGGGIAPPGLSGYSPEAIFSRIVKNARKKAARGQASAVGLDQPSVLLVELSRSELRSELGHDWYAARMIEELEEQLALGEYDVIAFCISTAFGEQLKPFYLVYDDESVTREFVDSLFDGLAGWKKLAA